MAVRPLRPGDRVYCPLHISKLHGVVVRRAQEYGKTIVRWDGETIEVPVKTGLLLLLDGG